MAKKPSGRQNSKVCIGWTRNKLSDFVSELESGVSVSGEGRPAIPPEHGVLKVSAVSKGRFIPQQNKAILASELERARIKPRVGAILVSRSNTPELVGESARVRSCPDNLYLPDKLWQIVLRPSADIDEGWLAQILLLPAVRGKIRDRASGSSRSMYNISKASFLDLDLLVPPPREQVGMAEILENWDDALVKLDAMVAAKLQMKQGLMQQLLSGKRRLLGFKSKWVKSKLGLVAENVSVRNGGDLGWDRLYAVTKASGMIPMRAHVMGITTDRCKRVEKNWFAYNPMRLNIGSIARWSEPNAVMVSPDYVVFRCKEGELSPRYFEHLRQADRWIQLVTGSGNGSVRVRLYFSDIARFEILKPPFEEQEAIADVLDTCDDELRLLRAHRDALDLQKQGLMERLLTGALRVSP